MVRLLWKGKLVLSLSPLGAVHLGDEIQRVGRVALWLEANKTARNVDDIELSAELFAACAPPEPRPEQQTKGGRHGRR